MVRSRWLVAAALLWVAIASVLSISTPVAAQTVISPTIAQVFRQGAVTAIALQPDGKLIIGGRFSYIGNTRRGGLARLNSDGSLDTSWNPAPILGGFYSTPFHILVDSAGNVYVGGSFTTIGGAARSNIARLSGTTGAADPAWNPGANGEVSRMLLAPGGTHLIVGGAFQTIGGVTQPLLAKVSTSTGTVDTSWAPQVCCSRVTGLAIEGGSLFIGGQIVNVNGQSRWALAKMSIGAPASLDNAWNPGTNGVFNAFALDGLGNLYVAGDFQNIGGQFRNNLARISTAGTGAADSWAPSASRILDVAVDGPHVYAANDVTVRRVFASGLGTLDSSWNPSGLRTFPGPIVVGTKVWVGSTNLAPWPQVGFAALDKVSAIADSAWPYALQPGEVNAVARDLAGGTIVGGWFEVMGDGTTLRSNMARFSPDGSLDPAWNPAPDGPVRAVVMDAAGMLYAGGSFSTIGGVPRSNVAKLASSGVPTVDPTWNPGLGSVNALAIDNVGARLYVGGSGLRRAATGGAGSIDATWLPSPSGGEVKGLAVSGTDVYAGGFFTSIGGQSRNGIAKLSSTGTGAADPTWNPNPNPGLVFALAVEGTSLFVGGTFTAIGGLSRSNLARLSTLATGSADATWNPSPNSSISSILPDGGGSLFVGGPFSVIGGQTRYGLAKIASTGSGATSSWISNAFTSLADTPLVIGNMGKDPDGTLYVGGSFVTIGGQSRSGYAVVSPKNQQTISFAAPAPTVLGAGPVPLSATATSGLAVTFTSLTPSKCGVSGSSATLLANGVCTIAANQAGNAAFFAAPQVVRSFTIGVPSAPTITAMNVANGQIAVSFTTPADTGGSPIVGYTVRCTSGATTSTASGPASPIVVGGLTNGVSYTCTVTADNGNGEGLPSDPGEGTPATGSGTPPTINAGSLDFKGQSMGTTSQPLELTLTNSGPFTVNVGTIALSSQFGQTNNCSAIPGGGNCKVQVTFSPAVVSGPLNSTLPVSGSLVINTDSGNLSVTLSGTAEKSLVTHYYRSILRRAPDDGGKAFWQNEAARVVNLGAHVNETWYSLAGTFYASPEYTVQNRNTTEYVRDLYNTFYNRAADDGGLNFWTGQINAGLPREVVLIAFMFSAEFANFTNAIFGNTPVRAELNTVMDFYRGLLARLPDDGGFAYWRNRFRAAQCQGAGAVTAEVEAISSAFTVSGEYAARGRNDGQYVTDLYNGFMRRGGDLGGYQYWVNQIASGARTREQVRVEFRNSPEFQAGVNAIIAQGCLQ